MVASLICCVKFLFSYLNDQIVGFLFNEVIILNFIKSNKSLKEIVQQLISKSYHDVKIKSGKVGNIQNSQLLTVVYGAIVSQVIKDSDGLEQVNEGLQKIGCGIGQRIVDEYMNKVSICNIFDDIVKGFVKVVFGKIQSGLKTFLGVSTQINDYKVEQVKKETFILFQVIINENPLLNYVQLPQNLNKLEYQNILCGIIRGALFTLNLEGTVTVSKDKLKQSNEATVFKVQMKRIAIKYDQD